MEISTRQGSGEQYLTVTALAAALLIGQFIGALSPVALVPWQVVLVHESGPFEEERSRIARPAGRTSKLSETVNAVAETEFEMRRFPFDAQRLEAIFEASDAFPSLRWSSSHSSPLAA
jgi:hypothetical protein